jgi:hypothetical protein
MFTAFNRHLLGEYAFKYVDGFCSGSIFEVIEDGRVWDKPQIITSNRYLVFGLIQLWHERGMILWNK